MTQLPRIGGFRNGPEQGGTGITVRYGVQAFKGSVDYAVAPTVDGRTATRETVVVSPAGTGDILSFEFGVVVAPDILVSDERIIGYDVPTDNLLAGLTFEGFRILNGSDIQFVWQNVADSGITIPSLIWPIVIGRV
jgi:hypothetical protein